MSGFLTSKRTWECTTFVDHVSDYVYVHLMRDFTLEERIQAKTAYEKLLTRTNRRASHYHADNGRFADEGFLSDINEKLKPLPFVLLVLIIKMAS